MNEYSCAVIVQDDFSTIKNTERFKTLFDGKDPTARIGLAFSDGVLTVWDGESDGEDALLAFLEKKLRREEPVFAFHSLSAEERDTLARHSFLVGSTDVRLRPLENATKSHGGLVDPWAAFLLVLDHDGAGDRGTLVSLSSDDERPCANIFIDPIFLRLSDPRDLRNLLGKEDLLEAVFVPPPRPVEQHTPRLHTGSVLPFGALTRELRSPLLKGSEEFDDYETPAILRVLQFASYPLVEDLIAEGGKVSFRERPTGRCVEIAVPHPAEKPTLHYRLGFLLGDSPSPRETWCERLRRAMLRDIVEWRDQRKILDVVPSDGESEVPAERLNLWDLIGPDRKSLQFAETIRERSRLFDEQLRERYRDEPDPHEEQAKRVALEECYECWRRETPKSLELFESLLGAEHPLVETLALIVGAGMSNDDNERRPALGLAFLLFWPVLWPYYGRPGGRRQISFEGWTAEAFFEALALVLEQASSGDVRLSTIREAVESYLRRSHLVNLGPTGDAWEFHVTEIEEPISSWDPDLPQITERFETHYVAVPCHGGWRRAVPFLQLLAPLKVRIVQGAMCARESSPDEKEALQEAQSLLGASRWGLGFLMPERQYDL